MVKNRQENESGAEEENVEDISLNLSEKAVANGEGQGSLSHSHNNHHQHHQNNNVVVVDNADSTPTTTTTTSHSDDAKKKKLNGGINSSTTLTTPDSCNNHKQKHYNITHTQSLLNENHHSQVPDRHKNEKEEKDDDFVASDANVVVDGVDRMNQERPTLALRNSMTNHSSKLNENGNANVTTQDNDDTYELSVRSSDNDNPTKSKGDLTIISQMSTTSTLSEFTDTLSVSEDGEGEEEEDHNLKTENQNLNSQRIQQAHNSRTSNNSMRAIINSEISANSNIKGNLSSPDSSVQFYIGNSTSNIISPEEIIVNRMNNDSNDPGSELRDNEIVEKNQIVPRHSPIVKCGNNVLRKRPSNDEGRDNLAFILEDEENRGATSTSTIIDISQIRCDFRNGFTRKEFPEGRFPEKNLSVQEENLLDNLQRTFIRDLRKQIYLNTSQEDGVRLETFIKLFQKKELLRKLFDLFDYNQHQKLCQDEWIEFLKSRLNREERQVDFVEVLESVSYAVCGDDDVDFEQFCAIFRTKNVLNKFFRLIDRDLDGIVTAEQVMEFISQLSSARCSSRLTKENIKWLEKLFRQYVGDGKEIRKEDFNKIIQTKNQFFTDRVFDIFDKDASGSISLHEFLDAMHQFAGTEPDDKIRFLFKVYDVDGDGVIQCEELGKVMRACMEENGMKFSDDQIHELTMALFEDADVSKQGALTYEALKAQLEKHNGLLENLSISIERWLVPPKKEEIETSFKTKVQRCIPHQFSLRYLKNNYVYLVWLLIFILTNVGLFVSKCIWFRESHPDATVFLVLARAAGQCLNFNCTFIVIVMLRQCLTFLRARGASMFLPIDQHIYFHKMTGWLIFLFSVFHTVMHLINIEVGILENADQNQPLDICANNTNLSCPVNSKNWTYFQFLFDPVATSQIGIFSMGLIPGYAFNSGVVLVIILTTMVICSLPFVRRGGCFEVFYWTHLLYFLFWALLVIHAPNFWKWFIVPGVIFFIEQALRYYHWRMGRGRTCVSSGILLPSKVTHLVIRRPFNFEFRPGDYVFVRIPTIAKFEWHPFTISSAPEQDDALWLHIRAAGQWTTRLYEYFENEQEKLNCIASDYPDVNRRGSKYSPDKSPKKKYANTGIQKELREVGIMNDKSRKVDLKSIEPRQRVPTVGVADSHTTVNPSSSASSLDGGESHNDVFTSVDTISETDAIIKKKKLPIKPTNKPKLTSTKSLPNVHERMLKREVKMNLRNTNAQFQRSLSVNSMENKSCGDGKTQSSAPNLGNTQRIKRVPISFRYMRNKPTVIALKTPSFEGHRDDIVLQSIGTDRMAEEGRSSGKHGDGDNYDTDANELHPIMGTTRTSREQLAIGRPLEIYLDGPYGAPSSHIFRAEHAVLIATGIGVTPFASILQSIMHRYWASRVCCPNCNFTWCGDLPQSVLNLKKVDFFWINRDQRSFEWFVHLLSQLEIEQAELGGAMERFLDMHMYITSALQRTDMKAVGLQLALDLLHEKEKRDLITGLKTRTNAGRPNWNKIFKQLADQHKGKVTVFYCGPPTLARSLKFKCDEFGFSFRKELF